MVGYFVNNELNIVKESLKHVISEKKNSLKFGKIHSLIKKT